MKILVSEKLSEHKYKTPEGYLICTDAILARTGKQSYTRDELFQDGDSTEVNVDRPFDEVMNEKTIASFENKPITFDHPEEDVNIGNYRSYAVGYVRDVRQGKTDKGEDVILGNLVITDQDAINAIEQGDHTDLSCGYDCDIRDDGNGNYSQTNIRGNHLALCEQGRAGIAHIVDSKVKDFDYATSENEADITWNNKLYIGKKAGYNRYAVSKKSGGKYFEWGVYSPKELERLHLIEDSAIEDSIDDADNFYKYKFEYDSYSFDRKTREESYERHTKVANGKNAYDAAKNAGLTTNDYIVRVYKDNKLIKSFTSKHVGEWHGRGNIDDLKGITEDSKETSMSDMLKLLNIVDAYKKVKDAVSKVDLKRGIDIAEEKYGYFDFSQLKKEIENTTKHQFSTRELYEELKRNDLLNAYINRLFGNPKR